MWKLKKYREKQRCGWVGLCCAVIDGNWAEKTVVLTILQTEFQSIWFQSTSFKLYKGLRQLGVNFWDSLWKPTILFYNWEKLKTWFLCLLLQAVRSQSKVFFHSFRKSFFMFLTNYFRVSFDGKKLEFCCACSEKNFLRNICAVRAVSPLEKSGISSLINQLHVFWKVRRINNSWFVRHKELKLSKKHFWGE